MGETSGRAGLVSSTLLLLHLASWILDLSINVCICCILDLSIHVCISCILDLSIDVCICCILDLSIDVCICWRAACACVTWPTDKLSIG